MKSLITSDLQLSGLQRDAYRFAAMVHLAQIAEEHRVDRLLVLGDLTEEKDFHSARLVNDVVELFSELAAICPVVLMRGNHDYTELDSPFFGFLNRLDRVTWINVPTLGQDGELFLPHTYNHKRDWDGDVTGVKRIFAHNTFEGTASESGFKLSGIPQSALPQGVPVISGDVHKPQTVGQVTYVGSPYTVDFGDDFEARVLLLDGDRLESIPMLGPQKRLVELRAGFSPDDVKANPGDIVKVRYHLTAKERDRWPQIKADIQTKMTAAGMEVWLIQPVAVDPGERLVTKTQTARSDDQVIADFGRQYNVPKPTLDAGLELAREA